MKARDSEDGALLKRMKVLATAAMAAWLAALALLTGPARWELQHTYAHWIEGAETELPTLTTALALPVIGISPHSLAATFVQLAFWGVVWLAPLGILLLVWRSENRRSLVEGLLLGGIGYAATLTLLVTAVLIGMWAPFALL